MSYFQVQSRPVTTTDDMLCPYPVRKAGLWKIIWWEVQRKRRFRNKEIEDLFHYYVLQHMMTHVTHLLSLLLASSVVMVGGILASYVMNSENFHEEPVMRLILAAEIFTMAVYIASYYVIYRSPISGKSIIYISHAVILTFLIREISLSHNISHTWATIFFLYVTYALLPLRFLDAFLLGALLSFSQVPFSYGFKPSVLNDHMREIISDAIILIAANMLGLLTHFAKDMAQRKAFSEIGEYVKAKIIIQQETIRQNTLLLSLLPQYLVGELRNDLMKTGTIARDKIHMATYNPVSILYADLFGFTKMADRKPAQQVVELLNDMYCSFDWLGEKYNCLRIKLLGDCYYCVCGLPTPSPSDADNIVEMGLAMIPVVETVSARFKTTIKIRVGIHTGKVHCGVLGLKKQQFDIWSSDVILANMMESGGIPGRVHITAETKIYLRKSYTFEPGEGYSREPGLRGITTYFVSSNADIALPNSSNDSFNEDPDLDDPNNMFLNAAGIQREVLYAMHKRLDFRNFRQLKKKYCRAITLIFRDCDLEKKYIKEPDRMLQSYFVTSFLLFVDLSIVQFIILPMNAILLTGFTIGLAWVTFAAVLVLCIKSKICALRKVSYKIKTNRFLAQALAITTVFVCYLTLAIPMAFSEEWKCSNQPDFVQIDAGDLDDDTDESYGDSGLMLGGGCIMSRLPYAKFALLYTIIIMVMTGAFQIIQCIFKVFVMISIVVLYVFLFFSIDEFTKSWFNFIFMVIVLSAFLLILLIQSQESEMTHRLDFKWKLQALNEKEEVQLQQKTNEKLINNILPAHVACHFLKSYHRNEELYYEQFDSICALFACITNFSFLEESSGQSVSVLHDIISDFDEILSEPSFHGIEKIKSTGAMYFAASGLSADVQDQSNVEYVTLMADFALRLKNHVLVLRERHNFKFDIKIGISMGPVVAGVIGARKPQYDIWGDTVNVASRMYSSSINNEIQVTEEVSNALKSHGYILWERGKVQIKGKGVLNTYILVSAPEHQRSDEAQGARDTSEFWSGVSKYFFQN